ncbi:MAG TPA: DEAD/DEAH box helicase [Gemmatimonadaceae bacterium]|nr:DEAD/DEAH box helicase [Gemmatimonadaceae bacterium]
MPFTTLSLHPDILRAIRDIGFDRPTPIQQAALPPALEGRDLLACAMTGSGKTAAFSIPMIQRLLATPRGGTRALVVTPTRELAAQVAEHVQALAAHTPLRVAAIFGGVGMGPQETAFRRGTDIIVATPGRLLDHLTQPYASLGNVQILVLDEADRMLDMGFLPDIKRVIKQVPVKRQTLFFSATMPGPIVELSRSMLVNPVNLEIERKSTPARGIEQAVFPVTEDLKPALLVHMLRTGVMRQALVFTRTKHRANRLAEVLEKAGVPSTRIHGNRSQAQRTLALEGFKSGAFKVLVATDIAARGIDVEALEHVCNFDVPGLSEDYIHRVGRTARAGAEGEAYTFVAPGEENDLKAIERAIGKRLERRTLPDFDYSARATQKFEVPLGDRIAAIRARKAEERARAKAKLEARARREAGEAGGQGGGARSAPSGDARRRGGRGNGQGNSQGNGQGSSQGNGQRSGQSSAAGSAGASRGPARGPARGPSRGPGRGPARTGNPYSDA